MNSYNRMICFFIQIIILLLLSFHPSINFTLYLQLMRSLELAIFIQEIFFSSIFRHYFKCTQQRYEFNFNTYRITYSYLQNMKNQPKIIRQRKQSLNKGHTDNPSQSNCIQRESRTRNSSSLPKKIQKTGSASKLVNVTRGGYLFAWGQVPSFNKHSTVTYNQAIKIGKNVTKFTPGQKHIIYLTDKNQAYGVGSSSFGQLGFMESDQMYQSTSIPLLEECLIQDIFATPYCTFLITNREQVYACGLNNRGQLGTGTTSSISTPIKISSLCKKSVISQSGLSNSCKKYKLEENSKELIKVNRIQSVALAERLNTNQSKLITQQYIQYQDNTTRNDSLLEDNQEIVDIQGGPFHTLVLTSKGRVFYTGNIYKKSTIVNDEFTPYFSELNIKKIGKVQKIKAGLTSIGLLNIQGNLFILGALSENIVCDEPYNTGISCVLDFTITKDKISIINSLGQLYFLIQNKKALKSSLIDNKQKYGKFKSIQGAMDFNFITNDKGQVYFQGENMTFGHQQQIQQHGQINIYQTEYDTNNLYSIKTNGNYCLGLCQRSKLQQSLIFPHKQNKKYTDNFVIPQNNNYQQNKEIIKKMEDLQKQNQMLKQLLKKQNIVSMDRSSNKKKETVQCASNNKFQINNNKVSHKARTFDPSLQIPFEELELGKQISEGGYGIIYKALWRKTTVAVKIFKIDQSSDNSIKDFISQCHAMEALRHPNIVMFLGACTRPPTFAIVLQYCEGGTLWSILQRNGEVPWEQRRNLALDTARGMNYLHERSTPILHRDLKSLNLLLDSNKQVKLADFGWTKGLENYMTGKIGTYQWMAPQVVSSHQYTQKADVFSFGIILWEIASRQAPYRNIPGAQVAHDVLHKDLRPPMPKKTPEGFANLMRKCWCKNHQDRPSFANIIDELQTMQLPHY